MARAMCMNAPVPRSTRMCESGHPSLGPSDRPLRAPPIRSRRIGDSHIHVLSHRDVMQAVQEQLPVDPAGWPLCGHLKIAPGDFVNLRYGSNLAPIFQVKKRRFTTG